MTGTNEKIRSLFLVTIMVMSVFAMSVAFTGTVAAQDRTVANQASAPVTVFVGESVDISGVDQTGGGVNIIGTGSVGLTGISGAADGEFLNDDAEDFSFETAATGGYDSNGDDSAEVFVVQAQIETLEVFRGANTAGADVTDGTIPSTEDQVTVRSTYNFESIPNAVPNTQNAFVALFDSTGTDISGEVTWSPGTGGGNGVIVQGGNNVVVSGLSGLDAGETYTIGVGGLPSDSYTAGDGDSPFDDAPMTSSLTITDPGESISLRSTEATQGQIVTGDVTGAPGDNLFVTVPNTNTITGANSGTVFRSTGDVVVRADRGNLHEVELTLGNDGEASFQIDTSQFDTDTTSTFEVHATQGGSVGDSVDLSVNPPTISITDMPSAVVIGDEFDIEGEAAQSDRVKAWVKIGSNYDALQDTTGAQATATVASDDTFSITVDSGRVMNLEGAYRIVVTADEDSGTTLTPGSTTMSTTQLNNVDVKETQSMRANTGAISARLSSSTIAAGIGDQITMEGEALGQGNSLRLYIVGPRGQVSGSSAGPINNIGAADTVGVDDQEFSVDLAAFNLRGTYQIVLIGQGRNGGYGTTGVTPNNLQGHTQSEAVEIIENAHTQAGEDNVIVTRTVQAQNPQLTIDEFRTDGQVGQGELELSGQSNREDGTLVFLEVIDENDDIVASSEGEVNGSASTWDGSVDLSDVDPGTYTLRADDDQASDTVEFELVEGEVSTPTPTPEPETPTPTPEPETPTPTPEPETPTDTETATETTGDGQPGFGLVVALIALIGAALLAVRRNS